MILIISGSIRGSWCSDTLCITPLSVCDLLATQMNMLCNIVQELMLYKFKLSHNTICCEKGEDAVGHRVVTRWFQKFCLVCKNLNNQARSNRPKNVNYVTILQAIDVNLVSWIWRVSGELSICSVWFVTFMTSANSYSAAIFCFTLPKQKLQNF